MFVSIESLIRKPVRAFCSEHNIDLQSAGVRFIRQIIVFMLFVPCCILFRAQNVAEIGVAYRQMFTAWGAGAEYFASAFESLGLSSMQFALLVASLAAMALLYNLPSVTGGENLPLGNVSGVAYNSTAAIFVYGVIAVAVCWLALLANSDVSSFAYFQF